MTHSPYWWLVPLLFVALGSLAYYRDAYYDRPTGTFALILCSCIALGFIGGHFL